MSTSNCRNIVGAFIGAVAFSWKIDESGGNHANTGSSNERRNFRSAVERKRSLNQSSRLESSDLAGVQKVGCGSARVGGWFILRRAARFV